MTPIDFARNLARSDTFADRALGVAIVARGLADDDGFRQGWPLVVAVGAAAEYLGLTPTAALVTEAVGLAPGVSDAMLNRASR